MVFGFKKEKYNDIVVKRSKKAKTSINMRFQVQKKRKKFPVVIREMM